MSLFRQLNLYPTTIMVPVQTRKKSTNVQSMRLGDWVCFICGNLNFSFRNECNRCQVQQKNKKPQKGLRNRKPFHDITNLLYEVTKQDLDCIKVGGGFENLILLTPMNKAEYKDLSVNKQSSRYLEEYEKHLHQEEVSDFTLIEDFKTDKDKEREKEREQPFTHQDQGIAYCIMILGMDD